MKNKFLTLLAVAGLGFMSCEKEETIAPKDYTTYTVEASLNSEDGKEVPKLDPATHQPLLDENGNPIMENQYFYSVQYLFNLTNDELVPVVNSSDNYANFVIPTDPETGLTSQLKADGDWTIALTQYVTELPYDEGGVTMYMEYPTVGALINMDKNIEAVKVEDDKFETITLEDAKTKTFSTEITTIGYDWKVLDFSTYTYKTVENNYYLVKINEDDIFKFRFVDYYNADGEKGNVKFQFQLLK